LLSFFALFGFDGLKAYFAKNAMEKTESEMPIDNKIFIV